jgi:hypothetical protein
LEIGRFFLGLNVDDVGRSVDFYERLGFRQIAGDPDKSWAIVDNGKTRLGLYRGEGGVLLNFMDGRVEDIVEHLSEKGIDVGEDGVVVSEDKISLTIEDHDRNIINFSRAHEGWVKDIECPRCGSLSRPTGKRFRFGVFEGRSYSCEGCSKSFNAFYRDRELSYTVPKQTKRSLIDRIVNLKR